MLLAVGVTSQAIVPHLGPHLSSERQRREASETVGQPAVFYASARTAFSPVRFSHRLTMTSQ
jgi:hypothetical protein